MLKTLAILLCCSPIILAAPTTCDLEKFLKCSKIVQNMIPKDSKADSIIKMIKGVAELCDNAEECGKIAKNCGESDELFQKVTGKLANGCEVIRFVASDDLIECMSKIGADEEIWSNIKEKCSKIEPFQKELCDDQEATDEYLKECSEVIFGKYCTKEHSNKYIQIVKQSLIEKECKNNDN